MKLGTDMLAIVSPWKEGDGVFPKAGHKSTTKVRFNLVDTRRSPVDALLET